ncbi:family 20 glycosylhydrolase [Fimbriimonas ginsengisoli]|uniref:Glycoside hydrolase, family 20 n=1 Tax=Fimbriimonas ginsengisoli Gsoil 348 TaxID=661478 RepID=A0A068NXB8_FIMGI|nr:family 20 glycosylhydrolase [Fimbriimonas ginsengisoli]AIE87992.1 glycoside hydrolase, family 20 [Fimbriimonas ginsengisoli Gsoil 348]
MHLRMWTYDLAREQSPTLDHLRAFCALTREAGYNAIGLYMEHRFAYPSTPWSHGRGCVTPEMVLALQAEFSDLQIIPFINLLGHFEGMLYTEAGRRYAEEKFKGMQACPCRPAFVELANQLVDDILGIFTSDIIHIGGDETWQLGLCPECAKTVREYEMTAGVDGKAQLYGSHFGPLLRKVAKAGRRPAIWGDMFFDHPTALDLIPEGTLIFDWQYFRGPEFSSSIFHRRGFDVVYSPALHTYNAAWLHLPQSEENVREHALAAASKDKSAYGVCVTTWECGLFGNYETLLPAIRAAGKMLRLAEEPLDGDGRGPLYRPYAMPHFLPNRQLGEEVNSGGLLSIGVGISDAIIMSFLQSGTTFARIYPAGQEMYLIGFGAEGSEQETGRLPKEQATSTLNRLALMADMDPLRQHTNRNGVLKGIYKGVPFEIQAQWVVNPNGVTMELRTPPRANHVQYGALREATHFLRAYLEVGETHEEWARLMGSELQNAGGMFAFSGIRSSMKARLLLFSNPFLFWLHHSEELCGEVGDKALAILERAIAVAPDSAYRGVSEFAKLAIEFVRYAEEAHKLYAAGLPGQAAASLMYCRQVFENLAKIAKGTNYRIGGSLADIERCQVAQRHVEIVVRRVKEYGDGALGYLPSFETLTHPKFMPHDQANWWLINRWANE